jgi:hypothetical protein
MIGSRQTVPFLIHTLEFSLQLRESTESHRHDSRIVLDTNRSSTRTPY